MCYAPSLHDKACKMEFPIPNGFVYGSMTVHHEEGENILVPKLIKLTIPQSPHPAALGPKVRTHRAK